MAIFRFALAGVFGAVTCTAVAGDLLRGGYTAVQGSTTAPGSFTPPSVARARRNANDVLARTTQAINAVNAMQSAARKLAVSGGNNLGVNPNSPSQTLPNVPDGLGAGGLYPTGGLTPASSGGYAVPPGWTGVESLSQAQSSKGIAVNVVQSSQDAVLTWTDFNVGKETTLDFNQSKGGADESSWIAFNIVEGNSIAPSQILGSIKAGGQVYVIDQNGIIFGGSSQVNVHTLVASSLPIDTYLITNGLLNNPDEQFLFSAISQPAGANGSPKFTPPASDLPDGADGDVTVMAGAQIIAPANAASVGGRVMLVGPNVTNDGIIYTPDGQTILAAGLQVGVIASSASTLRGLDVYIGAVSDAGNPTSGVVTNDGVINVPEGDAYLTGESINQMGVIGSTTSVTLNGEVDLYARYGSLSSGGLADVSPFLPQYSGAIVLGPDSVTQILPEVNSPATITLSGFQLNSEVNVQGQTIHMEGNSALLAPNATINLDAGTWFFQTLGGNPNSTFINSGGQVYLDSGATVYAAGSIDVQASVDQNIISLQLLGPELADSPAQRTGVLAGQSIYVDIRDTGVYNGMAWVGTPLVDDVQSFVDLIDYTVGELTINGGTVNIKAGGSVVMQPGSKVDVAGGWIDYQGGIVTTSEVISGGHIYPISQATPDLVYSGFNFGTFTILEPKYAVSETYTDPILDLSHYEDSYISGGNGGTIDIVSPSMALEGNFIGNTVAGPRQQSIDLATPNSLTTTSMPAPSALELAFEEQEANSSFDVYSPTPPSVVFSPSSTLPEAGAFAVDSSGNPLPLKTALQDEVVLSPDLFTTDGFGAFRLNNGDGNVTIPSNVSLEPGPGGSITISAANLDIEGSITAPDGALSFTVYDYSPFDANSPTTQPPVNPARGHFTLGAQAQLNTAGLIVDDRDGAPDAYLTPQVDTGGTVSIDSYETDLKAGSVINVSGGVIMGSSGHPSYGNAGSITIAGGQDPGVASLLNGSLTIGSQLEGFSGATGGKLAITAQFAQVGGESSVVNTQVFSPSFFSHGGFSSFSVSGIGGLTIEPVTDIEPVATSLVAMDGPDDQINLVQAVLPVGQRPAVSLSFRAPGVGNSFTGNLIYPGNLVMGAGSLIRTDPSSSVAVTLSGGTVAVLGSIIAPGGTITIAGAQTSSVIYSTAGEQVPTVDLGPESLLSTAGATVLTPNALGYTTGYVLPGGKISVTGNVVAEAGSVLNVSGATATLDITPVQANVNASPGGAETGQNGSLLGMLLVPAEVDSSGGTIALSGGYELFSDATLIGAAGGPSATGGTLSVATGAGITNNALGVNLIVSQDTPAIPAPFYPAGQDAIGHPVLNENGAPILPGNKANDGLVIGGYIAVDTFQGGGFDSVNLEGTVQFSGPVSLSVPGSLTVATGGVIYAQDRVHLSSNYVALGLPFQPPVDVQVPQSPPFSTIGSNPLANFDPTYGTGELTISANLIDIGYLSLQGIGKANFIANGGDIRGDGTLDVAGSIFMQAGQIYPPTETIFTIAAYNYSDAAGAEQEGSVTIEASGQRQIPLSAGGTLNIYATDITQNGVLRAPLGQINLGWDGSGTQPVDLITGQGVDEAQNLTLGKQSVTSVSAVDPLTGVGLIIPYGTNPDGTSWIDPSGVDITAGGVPQKSVTISAANVEDEKGAVIDIKGGGDLLAYQFVPGTGGNNDILGSSSSFAIVPGYQAGYAPYDTDQGYNNSALVPGDQVYLNGSTVLPAGYYTLLPARYALLPGGVLVTPQSGLPQGASVILADGGSLVSGYEVRTEETAAPETTSFELDSGSVLQSLATYTTYSGNAFLAQGAKLNSQPVPRLPKDSGQLTFEAVNSLSIAGAVESTPLQGGLGGLVNISSPNNIVITGATQPGSQPGSLLLNASELDSFGAASLLIGGIRETSQDGDIVTVTTEDITVDNAGDPLTGSDIILAANDAVTLDQGAEIEASGAASGADAITVAGDGALVRVSSDVKAAVTRTLPATTSPAELSIGVLGAAGAAPKITGASITLDSSGGAYLDPSATVKAKSVALNSGQVIIELSDPGAGAPTPSATSGFILSGSVLNGLFASAQSLSLLSYSSIDFYGTGQLGATSQTGEAALKNFTLSAGEIRGFNSAGGSVTIASQNILLENAGDVSGLGAGAATGGSLVLNGDKISLGANALAIDQFASVSLNANDGILAIALPVIPTQGSKIPASLSVQGDLVMTTPLITGVAGAAESITSSGDLTIAAPAAAAGGPAPASGGAFVSGGLGASLSFIGASVTDNSAISAQSGMISLEATTGDLTIGNLANASLDVSGASEKFYNVEEYTNGGQIDLIADQGNVSIGSSTTTPAISVAAQAGGGNAGSLSISDPMGSLTLGGQLSAQGGAGGQSGSFSLDVGSLPSLSALDASLNTADFDQSRTIEVQTGDVTVDGLATAATFSLSADAGSITVSGEIDGSGQTGGTVTLQARGSVTLLSGAEITVAAQSFSDAQRGGSVDLEAGSEINGVASSTAAVDIQTGSTIDLSVAATPVQGDLTGTLLIRAPQTAGNTDLQVNPINGTITGASSATVEGYEIFNAAASGGSIDSQEASVAANGNLFAGNTQAISSRLLANNAGLASVLVVEPGAEIINDDTSVNGGNLTLSNSWNLSSDRFGPDRVAGVLTLRAAGNVVFEFGASLSDGFDAALAPDGQLWDAPLLPTAGAPSWSYRIVAGADFSAANFAQVMPMADLAAGSGSVLLGEGAPSLPTDQEDSRVDVVPFYFQTIRTGAGSIQISAGRDVQLLDNLATIYSAGTMAPALADFTLPNLFFRGSELGPSPSFVYPAQYTEYGGSVTITAQDDIAHYVSNGSGGLIADSSLELPGNWLYRQGVIDPKNGEMDAESTSWWTDFSNFYEGIGAFGGGNVTLSAGDDITNVDAVIPTNARMPNGIPSASALVQLGGGDLLVSAGNNISGGVYYVESGEGSITAGGDILTNATRSTLDEGEQQQGEQIGAVPDPSTWLPTTLFAGDASFNISAGGSILLGSVANPFLLPQGLDNGYQNRSYFSTFAPTDAVNVQSLAGDVTIRSDTDGGGNGSLQSFFFNIDSEAEDPTSFAAESEPWLSVAEPVVESFDTVAAVMPPTLRVTAFSASINLEGTLLLSPAPDGTLSLVAGGSINGLQINGLDTSTGLLEWGTAVIDLSDANPASIPSITSPLAGSLQAPIAADLDEIGALFSETGSAEGAAGVIETKEALHDPGLLHANDPNPVDLYAADGDISGMTFYSGKFTDVIASQDITDSSFYIQNVSQANISVVSADRDIIPYDLNSPLRLEAQQPGNELIAADNSEPGTGAPTAGDIQINGPGTLEVLAGRDLTLGAGPNDTDGTAVGITSIGNARDPFLPFTGAEIIVAAGLGGVADGLNNSSLDISGFVGQVLAGASGSLYLADLAATDPSLSVTSLDQFNKLPAGEQAIAALDLFYIVLRDAGRDHNLAGSPGYGNYAAGLAAIDALLPSGSATGNIDTNSKEITTVNGGDVDILDPSGQITVGVNLAGAQPLEQGIFTDDGGNISIYSEGSVNLGTSRIFTLHGGNIIIWSNSGDIDAGNSSKTVATAPPTLVVVDPQSANVETDLAGLATGGGIGVLATVVGVPPGNVDLIAPTGIIDAGAAGIRATGNLNLAAVQVLNAFNIQAGGAATGVPTVTVAAPNLGALSAASSAAGAGAAAATDQVNNDDQEQATEQTSDSLITVDVIGYGGGEDEDSGG